MNLTLNTSGILNEQILLFISDISNCTLLKYKKNQYDIMS